MKEAGISNPPADAVRYSLKQLVADAMDAVRPAAEKKQIRLESEIPETVPDELLGAAGKLKEAAASLLAYAANRSEDGLIRLSVFGKTLDDTVHLLVSVRFLPEKETPSDSLPERRTVRNDPNLDLEVAGSVLSGMGSELKTVCSADDWKNLYFEIDQRIPDSGSSGRTATEEMER